MAMVPVRKNKIENSGKPKLKDYKDVATNKPLLYHVIKACQWLFKIYLIDFDCFYLKELSKTNFKIVDDFYGEK